MRIYPEVMNQNEFKDFIDKMFKFERKSKGFLSKYFIDFEKLNDVEFLTATFLTGLEYLYIKEKEFKSRFPEWDIESDVPYLLLKHGIYITSNKIPGNTQVIDLGNHYYAYNFTSTFIYESKKGLFVDREDDMSNSCLFIENIRRVMPTKSISRYRFLHELLDSRSLGIYRKLYNVPPDNAVEEVKADCKEFIKEHSKYLKKTTRTYSIEYSEFLDHETITGLTMKLIRPYLDCVFDEVYVDLLADDSNPEKCLLELINIQDSKLDIKENISLPELDCAI